MQRHRHQEFIRFLNLIEAQMKWTPDLGPPVKV
jgi:hypothetical protein